MTEMTTAVGLDARANAGSRTGDSRTGGGRARDQRAGGARAGERAEGSRVEGNRGDGTRPDETVVGAGTDRYLTFALGGEVYALPILDITEIMEFRSLTVVPMMPSFIRGVINLRGRVVPVVDMAARFGRGMTQVARRTSIIIVETPGLSAEDSDEPGTDMGIMVDAVNKVVHLSAEDIEPPPAFGAGIRSDFISGMAKYDGQFIIVLDVSRVLSVDEMVALGQVASATAQTAAQAGVASADPSAGTSPGENLPKDGVPA